MEKLIELFKEYVDNHGTDTKDIEKEYGVIDDGQGFLYGTREYLYEIIVSKKFGFIKWLVENDKIDTRKIDTRLVRYVENYYDEAGYWMESSYEDYSDTNTLIMLLSISDTPIDDLISYLK